jgi:hypothetical protein
LNYEVRKKDVAYISFFCGVISVAIVIFACMLAIPDSIVHKEDHGAESSFKELFTSIYAFRFLFILILIVTFCGVVLKVMR